MVSQNPTSSESAILCTIFYDKYYNTQVAYLPTQILSELFKHNGLDGLFCKSHLGSGNNYILFEPAYVNMISCEIKTTKSINFKFDEFDGRGRF